MQLLTLQLAAGLCCVFKPAPDERDDCPGQGFTLRPSLALVSIWDGRWRRILQTRCVGIAILDISYEMCLLSTNMSPKRLKCLIHVMNRLRTSRRSCLHVVGTEEVVARLALLATRVARRAVANTCINSTPRAQPSRTKTTTKTVRSKNHRACATSSSTEGGTLYAW
ncbi:hypothetical protein KCU61_g340, partial [Aureobasidium melanogenum]